MPSDGTKILKCNQYQKSDKAPFIIYAVMKIIISDALLLHLLLVMKIIRTQK